MINHNVANSHFSLSLPHVSVVTYGRALINHLTLKSLSGERFPLIREVTEKWMILKKMHNEKDALNMSLPCFPYMHISF